jgi:diguanylate cyclase (GGDEF)-like protein
MAKDFLNTAKSHSSESVRAKADDYRLAYRKLLQNYESEEKALWHWQHFELQMIRSQGLQSLLDLLLCQASGYFGLERVSLQLLDVDRGWSRCFVKWPGGMPARLLLIEDIETLQKQFPRGVKVRELALGSASGRAILMPLVRQGALMGCLRFDITTEPPLRRMLTSDRLTHFAALVAICLENCSHRELLHQQSQVDTLTGVLNRRGFEHALREECARAVRSNLPLTAMFVDLDHFKRVNDRHGHPCGDRVLTQIAASIGEMLRPTDSLSRYGGEEFVALLPACDEGQAAGIAERINLAVVALPLQDDSGESFGLSCSVGYSCWHAPGTSSGNSDNIVQQLIARADQALYRAKQEGRNRARYVPLDGSADACV